MMRVIIEEGLADEEFIADADRGLRGAARRSSPTTTSSGPPSVTGIAARRHPRGRASRTARPSAPSIVYAMGVTQHTSGTEQVRALANLAMLTGNIGRPGTGVNPLRGQNNVQGACDLACLPNCLPGYQQLDRPGTLDRVCDFWETERELSAEPGLTLVEMMDAAVAGELKAMYIMGENPVHRRSRPGARRRGARGARLPRGRRTSS